MSDHKFTDSFPDKIPSVIDSKFIQKYAIIATFLDDDLPFLESLPKKIDPNLIILEKLSFAPTNWPLIFFVARKRHTFKSLSGARQFIRDKYNKDLFPLLISSIRKYGTKNLETNPKNSLEHIPYGFRYYIGKSIYPDTPAVSTASILYSFEEGYDRGMIDDEHLEDLNNYIKTIPLLSSILKRGDLVFNTVYGGYRNNGVLIWDGEKAINLYTDIDDYGSVPPEFKTLTEFPFGYFYEHDSSMGIEHNHIQWMDLSLYAKQAKDNFDGKESFIDVKEMVNGKEKIVRIYLVIVMYDEDDKEILTVAEDYEEFLLLTDDYFDTGNYNEDRREIWVERTAGEDARLSKE